MNDKDLSKYLSLVLRHQPEKIGIVLDSEGFTPLNELIARIRTRSRWSQVTEGDIRRIVRQSDKQRYEIVDGQIRARYGHSVEHAVLYAAIEPPEILFHGTSPEAASQIRLQGLLPMARQYVHHSTEVAQAEAVGRRHCHKPIILRVHARDAWGSGVIFHQPEDRLYISGPIPAQFVEFPE